MLNTVLRTSHRHLAALITFSVICVGMFWPVSGIAAPEVTISVDRNDISVGDQILYSLTVRYDSTKNIIGPGIGSEIGSFAVLRDTILSESAREGSRKVYKRQIRLTAFETGDLWIPAIAGELVDTLGQSVEWSTDSMNVAVVSVLGADDPDSADIRAIKAQYEAPEKTWIYWTIAGAVLLAGLIAWWLWRRRRGADVAAEDVVVVPAWETALAALGSMRGEIDPSTDGGRLWYFRLSEILRRYFDQLYGWTSIDETTKELLRRLRSAPFDPENQDRVREFFNEADRIRYAKTAARDGRPEVDWDWVREFVETTRHVPTLPTSGDNGDNIAGNTPKPDQVTEGSEAEVHS